MPAGGGSTVTTGIGAAAIFAGLAGDAASIAAFTGAGSNTNSTVAAFGAASELAIAKSDVTGSVAAVSLAVFFSSFCTLFRGVLALALSVFQILLGDEIDRARLLLG